MTHVGCYTKPQPMITPAVVTPKPLTEKQRVVLSAIARYYSVTAEPCSVAYLARRLKLGRSTIRQHLRALYLKGWLPAPAAPKRANLRRRSHLNH